MAGLSRRQAISTICGVAGLSSGCLGSDETQPYAPLVVAIFARNFHHEAHLLDVTLRHNGTQVHNSSHELAPAQGRPWTEDRVDGPWGDGRGALKIEVTVDEADSYTHRYTDDTQECFVFGPTIATGGAYGPWIAIGSECK